MGYSLSIEAARKQLPELIDKISAHPDEPVSITVDGKAALLIVDPHHYELIRRLWDRHWDAIRELQERHADEDPDEIYRTITEIVEEIRQQRHDDRTASATRLD